jgi:glycosyltransferase involved in cell wall biosynthesis
LKSVNQIIVVDDGSTDSTAREAERAGADVLSLGRNRGKGEAMNAGARASSGEALLFLDADLGDSAAEAGKLLDPVLTDEADMVIADFPKGSGTGGGFGLAVCLARAGIRLRTGREMSSPLSGQRALRRELFDAVGGIAPGFGAEVALTIDALRRGFRVVEVPVQMTHRVTGRDWSGIRHRARQFSHIARALLRRGALPR